MLVRCKHYSVTYPDGGHKVGDIFDLTKEQANFYEKLGWIEILPREIQEIKKGRKKKEETKNAVNLSNSKQNGRYLEHIYK